LWDDGDDDDDDDKMIEDALHLILNRSQGSEKLNPGKRNRKSEDPNSGWSSENGCSYGAGDDRQQLIMR
jgi:hypothetical protein